VNRFTLAESRRLRALEAVIEGDGSRLRKIRGTAGSMIPQGQSQNHQSLNKNPIEASVIIPTFNGASRIGNCLEALLEQTAGRDVEILVVNDGSSDNTFDVVRRYSTVVLINQANSGPAAARNRGALESSGKVILFTDDDCIAAPHWLNSMLQPFCDPEVVGAKGAYRTRQKSLVARFVQIEYEDRYRLMSGADAIDFIDTYSAAFRRERFFEMDGYDTSFPVACAEDVELSYRMANSGWKMKFAPDAIVYHTHPGTLRAYAEKKYKFAFWRVMAVRKNPGKGIKDSHTPQLMKFQLLFAPALLAALLFDVVERPNVSASLLVIGLFCLSTLPFAIRAFRKNPVVGLISPALLAVRACAQLVGVIGGVAYALLSPAKIASKSHA
jgi:cellulose synthase/poly-beta-1,6-N-acetylglucosamine synthase-like glycosyltransferase